MINCTKHGITYSQFCPQCSIPEVFKPIPFSPTLRQYYAALIFSSSGNIEQDVAKAFKIADALINFEEQG